MFWSMIQFDNCQQDINTYLTNEAVQERLTELMAVSVPIQAVRFAERVELLDGLGDAIRLKQEVP